VFDRVESGNRANPTAGGDVYYGEAGAGSEGTGSVGTGVEAPGSPEGAGGEPAAADAPT
jgi:hypothetical protein